MELVKSETGFRELENLRNQVWALIKSHENSGFGATMLPKPGFQLYFTENFAKTMECPQKKQRFGAKVQKNKKHKVFLGGTLQRFGPNSLFALGPSMVLARLCSKILPKH